MSSSPARPQQQGTDETPAPQQQQGQTPPAKPQQGQPPLFRDWAAI